ncbi:MAG: class I SAM-dependent methyltransferase [Caldimonas sp.]
MSPSAADADARAWASLRDDASAPYRRAGRFAWHFARGKLRWDPVFGHLAAAGLIAPHARVLDIGCGQGLVASIVQAAGAAARAGRWPVAWGEPPAGARVTGIELMPRDVARARRALGDSAEFVCADMRSAPFPAADTIVLLDVLHYVSIAEQDAVLARARAALGPSGRLVLRVGDADSRHAFASGQWVDRVVAVLRRGRAVPLHGRTLAQWTARLVALGFAVTSRPMRAGTPFANVLLVGTVAT